MSTSNLFKEFENISKQDWLVKVLSDRKGATIEELNWDFAGISATPFYNKEDLPQENARLGLNKIDNSWQIGERFGSTNNLKDTNSSILNSLEQGVSAINIHLTTSSEEDIEILFAEVQHEWISTHLNLSESDDPLESIKSFCKLVKGKGQEPSKIKGSIHLSKECSSYWVVLKELFILLPQYSVQIITTVNEEARPLETLLPILEETYFFLQSGQENGFELTELFRKLRYKLIIGDEYYMSVVMLRSIRLLVSHLCHTYGVEQEPSISIETWLKGSDQTSNVNYNLIKNTNQILGAAVGGADVIYPRPYYLSIQNENHNHRISRNINHVLQLESYIDRVVDPAGGSYFFESMTDQLCKKAWEEFQNRVEE